MCCKFAQAVPGSWKVAEAVQVQAEKLQEKVEEIVIEKIAERGRPSRKRPRRFSSKTTREPTEKKEVL
jgi:hypothetical protein